jgi:carbohydrate kinase (thermoresistant glucokinase family)
MTRCPPPTVVVVTGVSGTGKTTVGKALAARLGWTFQEGDDFHPQGNIAKMTSGIPLDDADRAPWLARVEAWISGQLAKGESGVIACSALKRSYRAALVRGRDDVILIYLRGSRALIARRLKARRGHFMPPALLDSQLAALEAPGPAETPIVDAIDRPIPVQVEAIVHALEARGRVNSG